MAQTETAVLGGGCFWCLEAVYSQMDGVLAAESGYMGGRTPEPTYRDVCSGATGHIEVVQVTFDPAITSYREILEVFFTIHDPTTRDRQGNDVGVQYRSVIFYNSDEQRITAEQVMRDLGGAGIWSNPIVTELRPTATFYRGEDYHQNYYRNNPEQPYCAYVVAPKLKKFREKFAHKFRRTA
jgi:peptide-methionine (S)-S-oxide reductase